MYGYYIATLLGLAQSNETLIFSTFFRFMMTGIEIDQQQQQQQQHHSLLSQASWGRQA
jgi:hypothetical protein